MTLKPHFLPKDSVDAAIGIAIVAPIQGFALFIAPGLVAFFLLLMILSGRMESPYPIFLSFVLGLITPAIIYLVFLMFTVWSIDIDSEGIKFQRFFGFPKNLGWDMITDVSPVSRKELILKGWLWPLLPAREMTPTLSSLGHYRISWNGGYCFFPPADATAFEAEVAKHIKKS